MRRLSGTDALFLSAETPAWHQHVGGLTILEPGKRTVTFDDVLAMIGERVVGAPKFRWKLKNMPLGLDRPVWVDDKDFDVRRHVRRIGVPAPGGFHETAEVAGMILSSQLDRNQPLWELWFLEGLAGGRVGLVMKYHHCLLDGMAGASLATILMDIEPDATGPITPFPPPEEQTAGPEPGTLEIWARLATETARRPLRVLRYLYDGSQKLAAGAAVVVRDELGAGLARRAGHPVQQGDRSTPGAVIRVGGDRRSQAAQGRARRQDQRRHRGARRRCPAPLPAGG